MHSQRSLRLKGFVLKQETSITAYYSYRAFHIELHTNGFCLHVNHVEMLCCPLEGAANSWLSVEVLCSCLGYAIRPLIRRGRCDRLSYFFTRTTAGKRLGVDRVVSPKGPQGEFARSYLNKSERDVSSFH